MSRHVVDTAAGVLNPGDALSLALGPGCVAAFLVAGGGDFTVRASLMAAPDSSDWLPVRALLLGAGTEIAAGESASLASRDLVVVEGPYKSVQILCGAAAVTIEQALALAGWSAPERASDIVGAILQEEADTVAGDAPTQILATPTAGRRSLTLTNCDAAYDLWVVLQAAGTATPTIDATSFHFSIPPEATLRLDVGAGVDVWAQNSSGAATTSSFTALEVR